VDATSGAPVLAHNSHRLFTAASTMKLVTAAAALDLLGPEYRYETAVEAAVDPSGNARRLMVRGDGDPSWGSPFHRDPLAPLDSLADSLAAAGLREVSGPLIIDQSRFDSVLVHPAWETFDLDWYYAAPVAPLAVMSAAFELVVTPAGVGEPARVALPYATMLVSVDDRIVTVPGGDPWDDHLTRPHDRDVLVLRGTIGAQAGPDTSWIAQTDPGRTAGLAFRQALERRGIRVEGPVEVVYRSATGAVPGGPVRGESVVGMGDRPQRTIRLVWRSPPLDTIIRLALERSDNWVTEQILKSLGAAYRGQGDWGGSTDLVEAHLAERVGVPREAVYMRDGSGLTPQGLLTPDAVVAVLRYAGRRPWGDAFRNALASPGEPNSTLERRLLDQRGRVEAKTGTLRHVNALSGYLRTLDGRELIFSIMSNGSGQPSWQVQAAVDRIVKSLIESES
jgi:D-alanyl-D-alanine carboxypeptidase/D-alanyl-D-alanine-endopeptidase (penicillin-binding protein 4)